MLSPLTLARASSSNHPVSPLRASAPTLRHRRRSGWRPQRVVLPLAPALALWLALSQHQVQAVASAPQPLQGFDLWASITGWLQQKYGLAGSIVLAVLGVFGAFLTQAQNIESARRQMRKRKPEAPSPASGQTTHGRNSPLVTDHTPHNLPQASDSAVPLIGRDAALARLRQLLEAGTAPVLITGMDGVGKTALALHHLRQRLETYGGGVVVLDGQRPLAGLVEQLEQFALVHFDQQAPEALPPEGRLAWLYSHWPLPRPVVLLLDELKDPADLQAMGRGLPERFRLLVTSRRQLGTASQRVPLEPLEDAEAVSLLAQVSEREPFQDGEERRACALAQEVGGLPLALWLLGRRLARDGDLELAELQRRLAEKGALAQDLQPSPADPLQVRGLRAGFQLAWEGMERAERELALVLGDLPPTPIPWELLALCAPPGIGPKDWREARVGLAEQHLIERPLAGLVQVFPLLYGLFANQAGNGQRKDSGLIRQGEAVASGQEQRRRQGRLVGALRQWLPEISDVLEARSWERQQRCLPLLGALSQWPAERWPGAAAALPHLARGRLLSGLGTYASAEKALWTALCLTRQIGGSGAAAQEAGCLVALAGLARERDQLKKAEEQCREALAVLKAAKAGDDLMRAEVLNGLGLTLNALAKSEEAEKELRKALDLRLKQLGGAHRLVQISRNNLAMSLRKLGRATKEEMLYLQEAEKLYSQVLEALQGDPCEVSVMARYNLSFVAYDAGQLERAYDLREQAVALAVRALGEDHPKRGLMLMSLGVVAEKLGRREEAEAHYRRAAQLTEVAWGADHPHSQNCRLTLEAFLAAPTSLPAIGPPSDPTQTSG